MRASTGGTARSLATWKGRPRGSRKQSPVFSRTASGTPSTDSQHWPEATALRLVLEKGSAGARYHAVAEEGMPFRDIAGVIGRRLNVPVVSKTPEEATKHFGWFTHFAAIDCPASSELTRKLLGWQPKQPGLIADLDRPGYFES